MLVSSVPCAQIVHETNQYDEPGPRSSADDVLPALIEKLSEVKTE